MRMTLTYQRQGRDPVDLAVQLEAMATVGQLAEHLALADPLAAPGEDPGAVTLALGGSQGRLLGAEELVAECGLASGATVTLAPASSAYGSERADAHAVARLRVLAGPDRGREFPLLPGSAAIGRERGCEVRLTDPMVSRRHVRLNVGETVEIIDQGSANGVQVGMSTVPRATLRSGDVVTIGDTEFEVTLLQRTVRSAGAVEFVRPARVVRRHQGREFEAPQPPERQRPQRFPTIALVAPLIMGAVLYAVTENAASLLFVALSPLMLVGSALESRIVSRREFREAVAAFDADLAGLVGDVGVELENEVRARLEEHPSTEECVAAARGRAALLWSRRPDLPGFGQVRLGLGSAASRSSVKLPMRNRAPYEQVQKLEQALEPLGRVAGVPVVADLAESAIGVVGPREPMLATARALVAEIVALHSPAELSVAALVTSDVAADWDWLKWLPHTSPAGSPLDVRHLAASQPASAALVNELETLLDARQGDRSTSDGTPLPRVLLVVEQGALVEHNRLVALAEAGPALGIHVLWLAARAALLPAPCQVFVETSPHGVEGRVGNVVEGEEITPVRLETLSAASAAELARDLAPVADVGARDDDASDLPRSISQFATLKDTSLASRAESVVERWLESGSVLTGPYAPDPPAKRAGNLRAVLGQSAQGPHTLDLRTDGPHALVGGTTGSGKSELLQSWILGLAAAHSPERVTFLLVDYKGGSAFADCDQLPHTIGLVTDLGPAEVRRALTSLSAELRYREGLLADHDAKDLVELESHGVVTAPPSLVIVVDEFAALVQEVPEFVEGVVNVAQRGRSLGLHLILATQQPSGVIKGNLRANTNLRVSLRMADEADSTDVLGSADAADFDPAIPGRAVSKSGPRRMVRFQAAYAGGWTSDEPEAPDVLVEELSLVAPVAWELPPDSAPVPKDRDATDIKRLVRTIVAANELAGIPAPRKAWLPMLPAAVDVARLARSRWDHDLVFARGDDPEDQRQPEVAFRPDQEGNLVVYGTGGSGKSTLLRSLAISAGFSQRGGPCHVYGLDFGSRALGVLEELPHVGSIVAGADHERVTRLLTWLRQLVEERASRYSAVSAGSIADYRRIAQQPDEPRILLLLDGVPAFRQAYETTDRARFIDMLTAIASEGRPVGVHVVLSSGERAGVHTALASAVQRRIVLRMPSDDDYSLLGVPTDVLSRVSPPGRGLDRGGEIQVGILGLDGDDVSQAARIRDLARALREAGTLAAPPIRSLPTLVPVGTLDRPVEEVALGLDSASLAAVGVDARGGFVLTGPPGSGRSSALWTLVHEARAGLPDAELHYLGHRRSPLASWPGWSSVSLTLDEVTATAQRLGDALTERAVDGPRLVVVVESAGDLVASPAESALQRLVKLCLAEEQWFVAEGEVSTLRSQSGFLALVKSSRRGLALQPDQESGSSLFSTPFPRVNRGEFPEGRGFLVGRGRTSIVQVALTAAASGSDRVVLPIDGLAGRP